MSEKLHTTAYSEKLHGNLLGVLDIVFLVMAAVAPLTGVVVVAGLTIALGNGGGAAASFVIMAVILLLFAVGYAQMSKILVSAGGFYSFVVKGLGRIGGLVAGFIAMMGYNFFVVGTIGTSGFFLQTIIADFTGFNMSWYAWGILSMALCFVSASRGIDFSAKVLGVALVLETLCLVVFDIAVLFNTGFHLDAFSFHSVFSSGSLSIGLLLAATAFLGFEATALFGEEAKEPTKTVPRATYLAICLIGLILAVSTWALVSATGVAQAQSVAQAHLANGDLLFALATTYVGSVFADVIQVLLLVSLTAAMLAFHNSAARYIFSLGRAGVLPHVLSHTRRNGVPQTALTVQASFAVVVSGALFVSGFAPLTSVVPSMIGFGTLCILVLQMLAALSIVVYFRRVGDPRWWSTFVAPGVGFLGLLTFSVMAAVHFNIVSGSDALWVNLLPLLLVVALIGGVIYGFYLKSQRVAVYEGLSKDIERFNVGQDSA